MTRDDTCRGASLPRSITATARASISCGGGCGTADLILSAPTRMRRRRGSPSCARRVPVSGHWRAPSTVATPSNWSGPGWITNCESVRIGTTFGQQVIARLARQTKEPRRSSRACATRHTAFDLQMVGRRTDGGGICDQQRREQAREAGARSGGQRWRQVPKTTRPAQPHRASIAWASLHKLSARLKSLEGNTSL